jgi:hypothetical protein
MHTENNEPNYSYYKEFNTRHEMYTHCVEIIIKLKNNKKFYIGITYNPTDRLKDHIEEKNMKIMHVLTKTKTKDQTLKLEQELIERFDIKNNINQSGGGEGIEYDENYIYVLFY